MKEPHVTILKRKDSILKDKEVTERKDVAYKEIEKVSNLFNLEDEIGKLKIYVPLSELIRNDQYKS